MEINKITFSRRLSHGSGPWEAQGLPWTLPPLPLSVQRRCAWTSSAWQVGLIILCFLCAREMSLSPFLPSTQDQLSSQTDEDRQNMDDSRTWGWQWCQISFIKLYFCSNYLLSKTHGRFGGGSSIREVYICSQISHLCCLSIC